MLFRSVSQSRYVCANGSNITSVPKAGATANIYSSNGDSYFYTKRYYDCGTQTVSHDASKTNNTLDSVSKSGSTINYQDFNGQPQTYIHQMEIVIFTQNDTMTAEHKLFPSHDRGVYKIDLPIDCTF